MKSSWNQSAAKKCGRNLLKMRVYTSQLLGLEEDLVMHGGGNTSVKIVEKNIFGEKEDILYVKGSGWDLATIKPKGFTPVKLKALHKLARLDHLSDLDMVKYQRMAVTDPSAPNPSVETILHGIIPFTFVDHTHADAVVTITNTPNGKERIREIYGEKMLIVPYVMPGFILAKKIYEMTKNVMWPQLDGMILMNHGVFTFDDDPEKSYKKMISIVNKAEQYLKKHTSKPVAKSRLKIINPLNIAVIRKEVADLTGKPILARLNKSTLSIGFSNLENLKKVSQRGPITPDHIIRTKRVPIIFSSKIKRDLASFSAKYQKYFDRFNQGETQLDAAPRWGILPGIGSLAFGPSAKHLKIIEDIGRHTMEAIVRAEQLGGWKALGLKDLFEMEYWSLEQAKLKKSNNQKPMQGKIALVSGAASGIGKACVQALLANGASVAALDINRKINTTFPPNDVLGIQCDVTKKREIQSAIQKTVEHFGGIDMLITNAGIFPKSAKISEIDPGVWNQSMQLNVTSHQQLLQLCIPYLELGFDPAVVIIGSKNVSAPGPGASAYSVAKAGLTQLGRVAALELGEKGIRVNTIHPNAVYDTAIWTNDVLKNRAANYGLTVEAYKTNNVLKTEVTSSDVAQLAVAMLGNLFSKTTGAQVPIDGGNLRVI